ncbi:MAG: preprotein translocase subunit SecG [Nitrospinales bacterium]
MYALLITVHIIVALFLVVVVLLQTGKGAAMGSAFGSGGSQAIFGSTGAGNFLTKLTTAAAAIFMVTSLSLTTISSEKKSESVIPETEQTPAAVDTTLPLLPETIPDDTTASSNPVPPPSSEQTAGGVSPSETTPNPLAGGQPDKPNP